MGLHGDVEVQDEVDVSTVRRGTLRSLTPRRPTPSTHKYTLDRYLGHDRVRARPRSVIVRLEQPARLGEELALVVQVVV